VVIDGKRYELSANQYSGAVHPRGYEFLTEFRIDPFPIWTYEAGGVQVTKSLFLVHGENSVVIEYEISGPSRCELEVRPLIAFRDYHSTTHANGALNPAILVEPGVVSVQPYAGLPRLYL